MLLGDQGGPLSILDSHFFVVSIIFYALSHSDRAVDIGLSEAYIRSLHTIAASDEE